MKKSIALLFPSALCFVFSSHLVGKTASVPKFKVKNDNSQIAVKKENSKNSLQNQPSVGKTSDSSDALSNGGKPASKNSNASEKSSASMKTDTSQDSTKGSANNKANIAQNSTKSAGSVRNAEAEGGHLSAKNEKVAGPFKKIEPKKSMGKTTSSAAPNTVRGNNKTTKFSRTNDASISSNPPEEKFDSTNVKSSAPESWTVESEDTEPSDEENFNALKQSSNGRNKAPDDSKWLLYVGVGLVVCAFLSATFFVVLIRRRGRFLKKNCSGNEDGFE